MRVYIFPAASLFVEGRADMSTFHQLSPPSPYSQEKVFAGDMSGDRRRSHQGDLYLKGLGKRLCETCTVQMLSGFPWDGSRVLTQGSS